MIIIQSLLSSAATLFVKSPPLPTVHYKYETVPSIVTLWTKTHIFPCKRLLQPENQQNPKNIRAPIHNQVIKVRSVAVTRFRLLNCRTGHLSSCIFWTCMSKFIILYILWTVHRDTHAWERPSRCTLFLIIYINLSSTRFEQMTVHHQQFCTSSLQYHSYRVSDKFSLNTLRNTASCLYRTPPDDDEQLFVRNMSIN